MDKIVSLHIAEEDLYRYVRAVVQGFGFHLVVNGNTSLPNESPLSEPETVLIIQADDNVTCGHLKKFLPENRYLDISALIIHEKDISEDVLSLLCAKHQIFFLKRPFTPQQLGSALRQIAGLQNDCTHTLFDIGAEYFLGDGEKISKVRQLIDRVSRTSLNVLINGEPGTGKLAAAQLIHRQSGLVHKEFLNLRSDSTLKSIPDALLSKSHKIITSDWEILSRLDLRKVGTLFLEEAADLTRNMQATLVGVLDSNEPGKMAGEESGWTRVVAATRANLPELARLGEFRSDLLYRLNVAQISIPPLRERLKDIPLLTEYFLEKYSVAYGKASARVSEKLMDLFLKYRWPRNIRELEETVRNMVFLENESRAYEYLYRRCKVDHHRSGELNEALGLFSQGKIDRVAFLRLLQEGGVSLKALGHSYGKAVEAEVIRTLLKENNWNRRACAEMLKISYKALVSKMREYNFPEVH